MKKMELLLSTVITVLCNTTLFMLYSICYYSMDIIHGDHSILIALMFVLTVAIGLLIRKVCQDNCLDDDALYGALFVNMIVALATITLLSIYVGNEISISLKAVWVAGEIGGISGFLAISSVQYIGALHTLDRKRNPEEF